MDLVLKDFSPKRQKKSWLCGISRCTISWGGVIYDAQKAWEGAIFVALKPREGAIFDAYIHWSNQDRVASKIAL